MENRFIKATDENIAKHREKYYAIIRKNIEDGYEKMFKEFPELKPTDEETTIFLNKVFSKDYMSNHRSVVPGTDIDYFDYIKDIQNCDNEKMLVVLLDENKQPMESKIVSHGEKTKISDGDRPYANIFEYVLSNHNCKYFILVHNHPHLVSNIPSSGDFATTFNVRLISTAFNIKLLDSCIISEFDFYSQYETEKDKEDKLLYPAVPEGVYDFLTKEKKNHIRNFLLRVTEDGLF